MGQSRPDDSRGGAEMLTHASLHAGRAVLVAVVVVACAMGGQESKRSAAPDTKQPGREKASGVILKVERAGGRRRGEEVFLDDEPQYRRGLARLRARPGRRSAEGRQDRDREGGCQGEGLGCDEGTPEVRSAAHHRGHRPADGDHGPLPLVHGCDRRGCYPPRRPHPRPRRPTRGTAGRRPRRPRAALERVEEHRSHEPSSPWS